MNPMVLAVCAVAGLGLVCAAVLVVAQRCMGVKADEAVTSLRACLPGANCGACGFPGCDGYAAALSRGEAGVNLCIPGAGTVSQSLARVLGIEAGAVAQKIAFVSCGGCLSHAGRKQDYQGVDTCVGAKSVGGGDRHCGFSCLGYGDCQRACPQGAICINDGLAHVIAQRCVGCGLCVQACPSNLLHIPAAQQPVFVACSSREKGSVTSKSCTVGCIGCKKCEKICPAGAVRVEENLAIIDPSGCAGCGQCMEVCPRGCMVGISKKV